MNYTLIVLASGLSRRFGSNKLLSDLYGMPLIGYTLKNLKGSHADEKIIVFSKSNYYNTEDYKIIINDRPDLGISYSIRLAIDFVKNGLAVFTLADMPFVPGFIIDDFVEKMNFNNKGLGMFFSGELYSPPSAFSRKYFNQIMNLRGDAGGKKIIMENKNDALFYPVEPNVLYDIDTIEDLRKIYNK
ncbi:nucleotidyltransferase family protein [Picrophilus oshimae]|uniref:Molybdenum cofactor cytidylyltransferase n=1 Tax=Picrophilus torridus (strain ATCC 700027 / DSM 9790 / JCM 10055 / NBRC 100828 / KAW 2/3) TaxID=1122961 RepID=A0A8G2L795_PICTO|nr:nucleotidyltransferase family protein [Picrophilus oshimae]SMD30867.1 molybdenum cofactor cytidylyltransferase [Picrophilus oshimae DSM 9789]